MKIFSTTPLDVAIAAVQQALCMVPGATAIRVAVLRDPDVEPGFVLCTIRVSASQSTQPAGAEPLSQPPPGS